MFRRRFAMAACGALALLLTAAGTAPAQVVFFPTGFGGTGAAFGGGGFYSPGANLSLYRPYGYAPYSYYSQPYYSSYSATYTTTPIYYGAASMGYLGGNSTARIVSPSPALSYRMATGVSAAAYENQTYPIQTPNYTATYPVSPPISVVAAMTEKGTGADAARVEVRVPDCAQIWFDGQKTSQRGTERCFTSPGLEPGQNYVYDVHAVWTKDGKTVDETRKVPVRAGQQVVVDFLR